VAAARRSHSERLAGHQKSMQREREGRAAQAQERARHRAMEEESLAAAGAAAATAAVGGGVAGVRVEQGGFDTRSSSSSDSNNNSDEEHVTSSNPAAAAAADTSRQDEGLQQPPLLRPSTPTLASAFDSDLASDLDLASTVPTTAVEEGRRHHTLLYSSTSFYEASVWSRLALAAAFTALVVTKVCDPALLVLAGVNGVGAVSMALALKRQWMYHTMGSR